MSLYEILMKLCDDHEIKYDLFLDNLQMNLDLQEELKNILTQEFNPIEDKTDNEPIFDIQELNGNIKQIQDDIIKLKKAIEIVDDLSDETMGEIEIW